jgi:hypothetical protein
VWETREIKTGFLWGGLKARVHFEDVGVHWQIILKWICKRVRRNTGWIDLAYDGQVAGSFQCGIKLKGSIICRKFLDQLRNNQLFKRTAVISYTVYKCGRAARFT